jgi:hypothetical protein
MTSSTGFQATISEGTGLASITTCLIDLKGLAERLFLNSVLIWQSSLAVGQILELSLRTNSKEVVIEALFTLGSIVTTGLAVTNLANVTGFSSENDVSFLVVTDTGWTFTLSSSIQHVWEHTGVTSERSTHGTRRTVGDSVRALSTSTLNSWSKVSITWTTSVYPWGTWC